jgi:hypothetical protein
MTSHYLSSGTVTIEDELQASHAGVQAAVSALTAAIKCVVTRRTKGDLATIHVTGAQPGFVSALTQSAGSRETLVEGMRSFRGPSSFRAGS